MNKISIRFYNFILPILFFEIWNVLLAFIFVVVIESFIISLFSKTNIRDLFKIVLIANLITTIFGYIGQALIRAILILPFIQVFGFLKWLNVFAGNLSMESYVESPGVPIELLVNFVLSMLLAFIISVFVEKRYITKGLKNKGNLTLSIIVANIISYIVLFSWILFRYMEAKPLAIG